ncbi:LLM class flavin-dependent oxidoreductase [Streptomyces sp. WP-1]|uniref:LLM class flavin-dependent oxidoreductase n=1 Tax=Streptomyces sp. WP-1 TaxID=3041497 RepID=UPI00264962C4|nr:LLM class flavin-dependent oxidoreductase [Streptomyces sp. WP-1]WKE68247.1 LLM class flavin-dependent oxidoreductase [Streptomyces sp. WP-1]
MFGDPWMPLTAAALATSRIRRGTLLTPVPRHRPQQLARQVPTSDQVSGGRVISGAGLGGPVGDECGSFGDTAAPREPAGRLDEGLELLTRFWSGEPVDHQGPHHTARDVTLLPATVQRPHPPVWIGGFWPRRAPMRRAPMRRAARRDGSAPLFETARHGQAPGPAEVCELVAYVREHRTAEGGHPFEIVLGGPTPADPAGARDVLGPLRDAGATWWDERQLPEGPDPDRLEPVPRRVEAGPPTL